MKTTKAKPGKRPTTKGENPLDVPAPSEATARVPTRRRTRPAFTAARKRQNPAPPRRQVAAFHLPPELLDQARDCVVALSEVGLTMSGLVIGALKRELARLQHKHNHGKPFPKRSVAPRTGRPLATMVE